VDVQIVVFPQTRVAALEHRGAPHREHETVRRLVEWRIANRLHPDRHRMYGVHYSDPRATPPDSYRVDFCVSIDDDVAPNPQGVVAKWIPGGRCASARHFGSRETVSTAYYLYDVWLPQSGEALRDFPIFFHYVNVGPQVLEDEMITDVYLPLR
jgi:AraC family transcriptional regulator